MEERKDDTTIEKGRKPDPSPPPSDAGRRPDPPPLAPDTSEKGGSQSDGERD